MTRQVTFGALLDAAVRQLDQAGHAPLRPRNLDLPDIARSMHALAVVLRRQLGEIVSPDPHLSVRANRRLRASEPQLSRHWKLATRRAHQAAIASVKNLEKYAAVPGHTGLAASAAGRHVDAATLSLRGAIDLLHSHHALPFTNPMQEQAGWTTAVRSPAVTRALVAELALIARHAAAVGTAATSTPAPATESPDQASQTLLTASRCLRELHGAVQRVHDREPVLAGDLELLCAIPINRTPARQLPQGNESVAELCEGVIGAAERLRRSARFSPGLAPWMPERGVDYMRRTAAASIVTTHNCSVLLRTLETRPEALEYEQSEPQLASALQAAHYAREAWLSVARSLDQVVADVENSLAPEVQDADDLALWTGRLAYADPQWSVAGSPGSAPRTLDDLATDRDQAVLVVAAVHHASEAMALLSHAQARQARDADLSGRYVIPAWWLPDHVNSSRRYVRAPAHHVLNITAAYDQTRHTTHHANAEIAQIAISSRAPSRVLAHPAAARVSAPVGPAWHWQLELLPASYREPRVAGPIKRRLQQMGVTDTEMLRNSDLIDRIGEQLIVDGAAKQARYRSKLGQGDKHADETDDRDLSYVEFRGLNASSRDQEREP